jgi:adenine-specific DNA-methyltransferase
MKLNQRDGGNRKFILVECENYADTLTAERVRRLIGGVPTSKDDEYKTGLGGAFTYCTLGNPVELDKVLSGETLPQYAGLGAALFHMATNHALDPSTVREGDFYLGSTESQQVWLIYKPDLNWLKSPEAALTLARATAFAASDPSKRHLVFAPARYVSQKMLTEQNIPVEFVPLPFALYRIDRS